MARCAFLGLGVMGFPMAGHLAAAGHEVTVFNRTASKGERWTAAHGGKAAPTAKAAAAGAELVFMCLGNDEDVRSVVYGDDGALAGLDQDAVLIDHTTASAELARELGEAAADKGAGFVDAPVSGGQAGAENGTLTVMCGGDAASFAKAEPAMAAYGRSVKRLGEVGSGQLTKMVNQICIAGLLQGLAEAVNFAQAAGLDTDAVVDVISKGAAQSWQMENRWQTMVKNEFDFGFAVNWMRKDLAICLEEARRNGAPLPVTALVDQFYREVQLAGGERWDTSSLVHNLRGPRGGQGS
jgi:3-hydroxyisobutyrate dehydrogenase-like beta-hydroxyacid dehydrogenase